MQIPYMKMVHGGGGGGGCREVTWRKQLDGLGEILYD